MKYLVIIAIFISLASQLKAQEIYEQIDTLDGSVKIQLQNSKIDRLKKLNYVDSTTKFNSVKSRILHSGEKLDSIKNRKLSGINSTQLKINAANDKILQKVNVYSDSLLNTTNKYQSIITKKTSSLLAPDSLVKVDVLYKKVDEKFDEVNKLSALPFDQLQKQKSELEESKSKVEQIQDIQNNEINEKLNLLSNEAEGQGNLPGNVNLPDVNLNTDGITEDLNILNTNLNIHQNAKSINESGINNFSDNKIDLPKNLTKVSNLNEIDQLKNTTNELPKVADKTNGYIKDMKNVSSGNIDNVKTIKEDVISKIPIKGELSELQKQDELMKEQQIKLQSYRNPGEYKKQMLIRSKKMINLQLATNAKRLQESVNKVSQYQNKLGTILSKTSDLSQKRDKLKRLRKHEKFVGGLTLQIQRPGAYIIDINPSLKYRLTSYWSIGSGWNERVLLGKHRLSYDNIRIYGVRSFTEVVIFKGVSFRLDAERMNTSIPTTQQIPDENKRVWVCSYMAGVKKDFSFIPRVTGNVQFMYNLYSTNMNDPYATKLNVRFGFEYANKKKAKR